MPSRWQDRSFPISVPLTRRPMATIHRHMWKSQSRGMRLKHHRGPETEKDHIQRKEEGLHSDCIAPHPGGTHCTKRVPQGLLFLQWRKERPRQTPSSPSTAGHFLGGLFQSCLMGITGEICRGSKKDGKGGGAYRNQYSDLTIGASHSYLQQWDPG